MPMSEEKEEKKVIKRIDISKALKLRLQGNTFEEIGSILGVSKQAVEQRLDSFKHIFSHIGNVGELEAYSEERKNILSAGESKLLASVLDEKAIEKAPLAARVMAFGTIYDKRRLEEGKSTENLGILGKILIEAEEGLGTTKKEDKTALRLDGQVSKKNVE